MKNIIKCRAAILLLGIIITSAMSSCDFQLTFGDPDDGANACINVSSFDVYYSYQGINDPFPDGKFGANSMFSALHNGIYFDFKLAPSLGTESNLDIDDISTMIAYCQEFYSTNNLLILEYEKLHMFGVSDMLHSGNILGLTIGYQTSFVTINNQVVKYPSYSFSFVTKIGQKYQNHPYNYSSDKVSKLIEIISCHELGHGRGMIDKVTPPDNVHYHHSDINCVMSNIPDFTPSYLSTFIDDSYPPDFCDYHKFEYLSSNKNLPNRICDGFTEW